MKKVVNILTLIVLCLVLTTQVSYAYEELVIEGHTSINDLVVGQDYTMDGYVHNYGILIQYVEVNVYNSSGVKEKSKIVYPNSGIYYLKDMNLTFDDLTIGKKTYTIKAGTSEQSKTLKSGSFYVNEYGYGTWEYSGKTIHFFKTKPQNLQLSKNSGNISASSYDNCINASFFNPKTFKPTSIAVVNHRPIYADQYSEWNGDMNDTSVKGALVYDANSNSLSVQTVSIYTDITVSETNSYYAVGGFRWGDTIPSAHTDRGRTALVYDNDNNIYCVVADEDEGFTQSSWKYFIEGKIDFKNGIHLDGGGSSQLKYNGIVKCKGDYRSIPVVIGIQN